MEKALYFSTSMHFMIMVSKSSAVSECTAATKLGVRIEVASQLHLQRRVSICAAAVLDEAEGRERGGEFHHRTLHRNAILAREVGKGRGDKVMLIQCQHCGGKVPKDAIKA